MFTKRQREISDAMAVDKNDLEIIAYRVQHRIDLERKMNKYKPTIERQPEELFR
jgi:hypothetical protein